MSTSLFSTSSEWESLITAFVNDNILAPNVLQKHENVFPRFT